MMVDAHLIRFYTSDHGTQGVFFIPGFHCFTMEPPWKNNERNISCIPRGTYDVTIANSPKYGQVYWVKDVPDRSVIRIHSGNFGGDISKGLKTHTSGCLLFGQSMGELGGQRAVLNSRITLTKFMTVINYNPFKLKITGGV